MTMEKRKTQHPVEVSAKQAEFAVQVLAAEEERLKAERRKFILSMFLLSLAGIFMYICFLGLLVIWFNRTLGWMLLGAALLSFAAFLAIYFTREGRAALETSLSFGRSEDRSAGMFANVPSKYTIPFLAAAGITFFSCSGGFVWLLYGLITTGEAIPQSVGLMALSILLASTLSGALFANMLKYNARVSSLRSELETHLETAEAGSAPEIAVMAADDYSLISRAEMVQTRIEIKKAVKEIPIEEKGVYFLRKTQPSRSYIQDLPSTEQYVIYEALDDLQNDPRPPNARLMTEGEEPYFTVVVGGHRIAYSIDEDKKLLHILFIEKPFFGTAGEEARDAS